MVSEFSDSIHGVVPNGTPYGVILTPWNLERWPNLVKTPLTIPGFFLGHALGLGLAFLLHLLGPRSPVSTHGNTQYAYIPYSTNINKFSYMYIWCNRQRSLLHVLPARRSTDISDVAESVSFSGEILIDGYSSCSWINSFHWNHS
jgi:hypothetical protein